MTVVRYKIHTPRGVFSTVKAAAEAMNCDRTTINDRISRGVEGYAKVERKAKPKILKQDIAVIHGVRWPISWYQYRMQDYDTKEQIYQAWCASRALDPAQASTADAFFDEMDLISQQSQEDDEDELAV